MKVIPETHRTH